MSDAVPPSAGLEEPDQPTRSSKKPKHDGHEDLDAIPEEMDVQLGVDSAPASDPAAVPQISWSEKLFSSPEDASASYPPYYMGEDDEERFEGIDELFQYKDDLEEEAPKFGLRVLISKEKYLSLFQQWRGALILKVLGKSVGYRFLDQRLRDLWQLDNGFELTDLEDDFYIALFFSREDYLRVLEGGPWMVMGHYLTITKWRPRFQPSTAKITSALVWVRFPGILPELLDEEILTSMGDKLGRTVKIDPMSLTGLRCRFAWLCVEVNLDEPLLPSLTVLDLPQKVEYEGLHMICFKCGMFGHCSDACPSLMHPPPAGVDPVTPTPPPPARPEPPPVSAAAPFLYGPWMLVPQRQPRKPPQRRRPARNGSHRLARAPSPVRDSRSDPEPPRPNSVGSDPAQSTPPLMQPNSTASGSRFSVLDSLVEDPDPGNSIVLLKQQLQAQSSKTGWPGP